MNDKDSGLLPLGDILKQVIPRELRPHVQVAARMLKPLTRVQNRLLEPCPEHEYAKICFQHSVLCQTGLPYRDPGDDVRIWEREQGNVTLRIEAGAIPDPASGKYVDVSLPWERSPVLSLPTSMPRLSVKAHHKLRIEDSLSGL